MSWNLICSFHLFPITIILFIYFLQFLYLQRNSAEAIQIFQDTAGWKNLETILHCLQAMIEGCGAQFQPYVDEELLNLVFQTLTHPNCFVREIGFSVCSSLVGCGSTDQGGIFFFFLQVSIFFLDLDMLLRL